MDQRIIPKTPNSDSSQPKYHSGDPTVVTGVPAYLQNRRQPRHPFDGPIFFSHFNAQKRHQGKLQNYSEDGICIQTDIPIKPGTAIYFRGQPGAGDDPKERKICAGFRTAGVAEVKWCKEISGSVISQFLIGAQYFYVYQ